MKPEAPAAVLVTVEDAAALAQRTRRQVYAWLKAGRLMPYRMPGDRRTYVDRRAVELVASTIKTGRPAGR